MTDVRAETNPWNMIEDRAPRTTETREFEQTAPAWQPASQLPEPHPRDGWVHRWIMVTTLGEEFATHFSQMRREGWETCQAEEYPELALEIAKNDNFYAQKGMIEIGGLVLCRLSEEGARARNAYYSGRSRQQVRNSTDELLQHQDKRTNMGTFVEKNRTQVSFGQGANNAP